MEIVRRLILGADFPLIRGSSGGIEGGLERGRQHRAGHAKRDGRRWRQQQVAAGLAEGGRRGHDGWGKR